VLGTILTGKSRWQLFEKIWGKFSTPAAFGNPSMWVSATFRNPFTIALGPF
jgi:hypothetical protein